MNWPCLFCWWLWDHKCQSHVFLRQDKLVLASINGKESTLFSQMTKCLASSCTGERVINQTADSSLLSLRRLILSPLDVVISQTRGFLPLHKLLFWVHTLNCYSLGLECFSTALPFVHRKTYTLKSLESLWHNLFGIFSKYARFLNMNASRNQSKIIRSTIQIILFCWPWPFPPWQWVELFRCRTWNNAIPRHADISQSYFF